MPNARATGLPIGFHAIARALVLAELQKAERVRAKRDMRSLADVQRAADLENLQAAWAARTPEWQVEAQKYERIAGCL